MPSPTQNAFMDRMRQMMFRGPVHRSEPQGPDYNEQPSADEAVQIPVGPDYGPLLMQQAIDWEATQRRTMEQERRINRPVDHAFDAWRYAQQAPQPSERAITRERLRYAAERLRSGNIQQDQSRERAMRALQGTTWTFGDSSVESVIDRGPSPWTVWDEPIMPADGLYETPGVTHVRKVKEARVVYKGVRATVLPVISLKSGFVEYSKGSPEPENGTQRVEFEKYAMERIIEWGEKNTQALK